MTDARLSQLPVEVIRTNLAVDAQLSQLAVEVIRPNVGKGINAVAGAYTLTGNAATLSYIRTLVGSTGSFTLTGVASTYLRTYIASVSPGAFTLTGQDINFTRPGRLITNAGVFTLTGETITFARTIGLLAGVGAFTLSGESAVFYRVRGMTGRVGAFTLTGKAAAPGAIFNVVDPVSGLTILHHLRAYATPYATADAAYDAWAATLGVDSTGTDYTVSTSGASSDFITTANPPIDGGQYAGLDIAHGGALALYMADPLVYTTLPAVYSVGDVTLGIVSLPAQRPVFAINAINNLAEIGSTQNYNLKLRKDVNSTTGAEEIIVVFTRADVGTQAYPIRCAYRVGNGLFEAVFTVEPANVPVPGYARVQYIVANETSDILSYGNVLVGDFTGTVGVIADDFSALRPFLTDTTAFVDASIVSAISVPVMTESTTWSDGLIVNWSLTVQDVLSNGDTPEFEYHPAAVIEELIGLTDAYASSWLFSSLLQESMVFSEALQTAFPVAITDTATLEDLITVYRAAIIAEQLQLVDTAGGVSTFGAALVDALLASDTLARFLGGELTDSFVSTETIDFTPIIGRVITDTLSLADDAAGKLVVRFTLTDTVDLADDAPIQMLFAPVLADSVTISVGYIAPDGDFTTWAVNTRTGAVTEYQNFAFNSFCQLGHKYLGSSSSGLYELNGDDDAGSDIIAQVKSGYAQFGGSKYSSFKAAYLGMRGSGDIILKLDTGDGKTYTYQTVVQDMQSTKVRLGKGLRARYFAFELISTGPDFDLDTVEFVPLVAQRRV